MTKAMPLKNDIVGVSASFSCVITIDYYAPSPILNFYKINSVTDTISDPIHVANLSKNFLDIQNAVNDKRIEVADDCWAFRI